MLMPGLFIVSSRPDTSHTSSVRSRRVETSARFVADLLFLFYFVSQRRRGCRRLLCRCLWRLMNHLFPSLFLRCSSRRKEVENRSFGSSRRDLLSFQTTFRLPPSDHAPLFAPTTLRTSWRNRLLLLPYLNPTRLLLLLPNLPRPNVDSFSPSLSSLLSLFSTSFLPPRPTDPPPSSSSTTEDPSTTCPSEMTPATSLSPSSLLRRFLLSSKRHTDRRSFC